MRQTTVLIIEPRQLFREGLRQLLPEPPFRVVAAVRATAEVLADVSDPPPELVVWGPGIDEDMEAQVVALRQLYPASDRTRFVVLTGVSDVNWLRRVAASGVDAILSQDISTEILQRSLDLVALGQQLFPAALAHIHADDGPAMPRRTTPGSSRSVGRIARVEPDQGEVILSEREAQILRCLMNGASNKAIARELRITEITVKAHVKALLRKTRVSNRTQVAIWAHHNNARVVGTSGEVLLFPVQGVANQRVPA